jgi:S-DNA-T family DNA segregation ATPase FtsK/SpoIIIE
MINGKYLECFNHSQKDDRNIVSKNQLSKFIEDNYFNGTVKEVHAGTTVTRYDIEVKPKAIKYFLKLEKEFNSFFNTNSCRVFQNGKFVCVEVPNEYRGIYGFADCISSLQLLPNTDKTLNVSIGESLDGTNINYNLAEMPHLLIGGQTGSGKSIFIHNLILSLLLQYSDDEVRLLLIDPKAVEFNFYRGLPQILEVVTNGEKAERKIREMCDEMDNRYAMFAEKSCRDIVSYNEKSNVKLPRIVVFIEELADLILSQGSEVIEDITRLVVKARACGIHIVLATQRPEAEFMTGKLRSNFQCRVAFTTVDAWNSKMILGNKGGAEKLKGNGDGLFKTNDGQKLIRFQSALITEKEIKKAVSMMLEK